MYEALAHTKLIICLLWSYYVSCIIDINSDMEIAFLDMFINLILTTPDGLVRTVVSISHCGCDDPGSIPGLDS